MRACIEPGCNQVGPGTRCPAHTRERGRAKSRHRATVAPPSGAAGRMRAAINQAGGAQCAGCGRPYVAARIEVDHIVPLSAGGDDVPGNVQPMCTDCHRDKSAAEARDRNRRPPIR